MRSSVLQNRDFVKLWAGQGVSVFGSLINRAVLPFLIIFTFHASAMSVAWLRIAELVPGILVGLAAGVLVDRVRRRKAMIVLDGARALLVGALPVLFLLGRLALLDVIAAAAVISVATVGFDSAYDAYLPTLVESDQLLDANGKLSAAASAAEVAGFGLAGALFQWLGGALALSVDALSFVVSAISLLAIRREEPEPRPEEEREPLGAALRGGLITLRNSAGLSRLVAAAGIQSLSFGVTGAVYVLFVSRTLHLAPALQGVLYALGGVASFATAGLVGRISARLPSGRLLVMASVIGLAGAAVLPAAFGPTALLVTFVIGQQVLGDGGDTLFDIGLSTLRQRHTDNIYLGRVSSVWFMLTGTGTVLGTLAGGVLAGDIGLRATLIVGVAVRLGLVALVTGKLARMHDGTALI